MSDSAKYRPAAERQRGFPSPVVALELVPYHRRAPGGLQEESIDPLLLGSVSAQLGPILHTISFGYLLSETGVRMFQSEVYLCLETAKKCDF